MKKIAKFHKVSFDEFEKAWKGEFPDAKEEEIKAVYEELKLPKRATRGSAGYDFYTPFNIILKPGETVKIPTGIRAEMEEGWVLNNTVGIIDSDYFYSDNEGHIFAKLTNDSKEGKVVCIEKGTGFMQGIFVEYGITVDDDAVEIRNGGFGSTTGQK